MSNALIGKYFHSVNDDNEIEWQGQITAEIAPGFVLVQLYEWIGGMAGDQRTVNVSSMTNWRFYDSVNELNGAYMEHCKHIDVQQRCAS